MKFSCSRDQLINALSIAQKGVSNRSTMPILEGIMFQVYNNQLVLTATDLEIGVQTSIPANVDTDGEIILSSNLILEVIRKLSGDEVFFDKEEGNQIKIDCLLSNFKIKGYPTDEFPEFPEIIEEHSFSMEAPVLREMIRGTLFSVAVSENIPVLTGLKMEIDKEMLRLIALDGYRLSLRQGALKTPGDGELSVIIPGKSMNELLKLLSGYNDEVVVKFSKTQIFFEMGETQFTSRLLEGEFINYRNIIPKEQTTRVKVSRRLLLASSERAALLAREGKNNLIKMDYNADQLIITSNAEIGDVFEVIPIENSGEAIRIAFNSKFFIDALKVIEQDDIEICLTTSVGPAVIVPEGGSDAFIYLILPVRIAEEA
ncbi:MAG: DNA polymerase III subunit beta [Eubacterium sp.]|nr:DNA polymerase III subunit beta [Eubacterium sp.]